MMHRILTTATEAPILPRNYEGNPYLFVHVLIAIIAILWLLNRRRQRRDRGLDARPEMAMIVGWALSVLLAFSLPPITLGLPTLIWFLIAFAVASFVVNYRRSREDRAQEGLVVGLRDVLREQRVRAAREEAEREDEEQNGEGEER